MTRFREEEEDGEGLNSEVSGRSVGKAIPVFRSDPAIAWLSLATDWGWPQRWLDTDTGTEVASAQAASLSSPFGPNFRIEVITQLKQRYLGWYDGLDTFLVESCPTLVVTFPAEMIT